MPPVLLGEGAELGPGAEFDRIRGVARLLGSRAAGLGDDCALIQIGDDFLAVSTDISVEAVHFRLDWIRLEEAGWRATAGALSDLAAVGAEPTGILSAVTMPRAAAEAELLELMAGVGAAAAFARAPVVGGDLSSAEAWSAAITVLGRTHSPVTRAGAKPGDRLWVTGALGGARSALEAWHRGEQPSSESRVRFAHPEPRLDAGQWLARHGAHAMIDLSDGIGGDAGHIAAASHAKLEIDLASLPVATDVRAEARRLDMSPGQFAAEGGEDYELFVALPPAFAAADQFTRQCGLALTPIGSVEAGSGVRFFLDGKPIALKGYNHFG
ncbi:MAG: thiamine-phosphate kinase [Gemmatimonadales bacterium]